MKEVAGNDTCELNYDAFQPQRKGKIATVPEILNSLQSCKTQRLVKRVEDWQWSS